MHLTPAMVDDLMAIEPLAAHDLLCCSTASSRSSPTYLSAAATCPAFNAPSIGAPGAMLNATCRLVVRQRSMAMDPWILDPQTDLHFKQNHTTSGQ